MSLYAAQAVQRLFWHLHVYFRWHMGFNMDFAILTSFADTLDKLICDLEFFVSN